MTIVDIITNSQPNIQKKQAGRKKKVDKYNEDRLFILDKIKNILGLTEENMIFYLHDIDNDKEKQSEIEDLKPIIETCFKSKNSAVFMPGDKQAIRPYMSLIRLVFKEMGYNIVVTSVTIYRNQKSVYTSMYTINKKIITSN